MTELAAGLPERPVPLALEAPATLEGRVTAASGADTSGAVVSLYRLGPERREENRTVRQRISLAEATIAA